MFAASIVIGGGFAIPYKGPISVHTLHCLWHTFVLAGVHDVFSRILKEASKGKYPRKVLFIMGILAA